MEEIVAGLRRRADAYVTQCDDLYAYLVGPFLLLKEPAFDADEPDPPRPSFFEPEVPVPDDRLPPELFEL
jgi:hypothetical protein